jgi:hypothetical protein
MPANQTLNSGKSRLLETPVKELAVSVGHVAVTEPDDSAYVIDADGVHIYDPPQSGLTVFAIGQGGARFSVFYADDTESVPDPTPPADSAVPAPRKRARRSRPKAAAKRAKPESKPAAKAPKKKASKAKAKTTSRKR